MMTAGTRIEVKILPWDPPHAGVVHDVQGVRPGMIRVRLDSKPSLAEQDTMRTVKISAVKVIA